MGRLTSVVNLSEAIGALFTSEARSAARTAGIELPSAAAASSVVKWCLPRAARPTM